MKALEKAFVAALSHECAFEILCIGAFAFIAVFTTICYACGVK